MVFDYHHRAMMMIPTTTTMTKDDDNDDEKETKMPQGWLMRGEGGKTTQLAIKRVNSSTYPLFLEIGLLIASFSPQSIQVFPHST